MKKESWKKQIIGAMKDAGTYRDCFIAAVETLAGILEKRDAAQKAFDDSGGEVLVEHTNVKGKANIEQNPMLRLINDLNRDALAYWRDLGLTPAGLKRIDENSMKPKKRSALAEALRDLGG